MIAQEKRDAIIKLANLNFNCGILYGMVTSSGKRRYIKQSEAVELAAMFGMSRKKFDDFVQSGLITRVKRGKASNASVLYSTRQLIKIIQSEELYNTLN